MIKGEGNRAGAAARLFITRRAVRRSYPPVSSLPRCGASLTPSLILCCLLALPTSPTSDPHTPFHRWRTASLHPTAIRSSESPLRRPGGTRYERPTVPLPQTLGPRRVVFSLPSSSTSYSRYITLSLFLPISSFLSVLFLARARSFSPSPVLLSRITPRRDRVLSPLAPSTYVYIADTCGHICSHVRTDVRAFSRIRRVGEGGKGGNSCGKSAAIRVSRRIFASTTTAGDVLLYIFFLFHFASSLFIPPDFSRLRTTLRVFSGRVV